MAAATTPHTAIGKRLSHHHRWQGWPTVRCLKPPAKCHSFLLSRCILLFHSYPATKILQPPFISTDFSPSGPPHFHRLPSRSNKPCVSQILYRCLPPLTFSLISVLSKEQVLFLPLSPIFRFTSARNLYSGFPKISPRATLFLCSSSGLTGKKLL